MAEGGKKARIKGGAAPPAELTGRTPEGYAPLVTALGGGVLDFPAMLAIADILPVMTAYVDRDFVYRFVNKPFAEWFGRPRKQVLGTHMRELIGEEQFADRAPILAAALAG